MSIDIMENLAIDNLLCNPYRAVALAEPVPGADGITDAIAASLGAIYKHQTAHNGEGPATDEVEEHDAAAQVDLGTLIGELWPAARAAAEHGRVEPFPHYEREERSGEPSAEEADDAGSSSLLPQISTYWRALNAILGDKDLGESGVVDAALERLFGSQDSAIIVSEQTPGNGTDHRNTTRRATRRPNRLLFRLGSRTGAALNATRKRPGSNSNDSQTDAWTTTASSLLMGLLTPGRLTDTVSEAVGRASSRLADRLLDRLTGPLQTVTGRASSGLRRLPRLLAPAQRLVMGPLAEPVRPPLASARSRRPRSELERLQRRLYHSESVQRASAAELARLRRRMVERRLASRAHWSVAAAERNGDMLAHLWTLQP
ncbi:hypothetical protein FJT64_012531 [Amphibalanus amphitrite]|uniref:Uncharacterized protein n=1 Tax=Amphibalanus amphitrite TaxID=1232801 RepID=A0A6A4VFB0_AMPAM|nr:hypothetical protein FJT64_012531 [Amphibalanus amphitrite]